MRWCRRISSQIYWGIAGVFRCEVSAGKMFGIEGALYTLILILAHNNNNLYATRLGATATQLGLIASLTPLVGLLTLIPLSVLTDRFPNKRIVVSTSVVGLSAVYIVAAMMGFFPGGSIYMVIPVLALANLPMSMYNNSWQAFFSESINTFERNTVFTYRTRMNMMISIVVPLLTGALLTAAEGVMKIRIHQTYYLMTALMAAGIVLALRRIPVSVGETHEPMNLSVLRESARSMFGSKTTRRFIFVGGLVYASWSMDWSIAFQAQFRHLNMTEVQMNLTGVISAISQFLCLGLWSRLVRKKGPRFVYFLGSIGFVTMALPLYIGLMTTGAAGRWIFMIGHCVGSAPFSAFNLTALQCLLDALPTRGKRSLHLAFYNTILLTINVVMPYLGVFLYTRLGESTDSMRVAYLIMVAFRVLTAAAAMMYWKSKKPANEANAPGDSPTEGNTIAES